MQAKKLNLSLNNLIPNIPDLILLFTGYHYNLNNLNKFYFFGLLCNSFFTKPNELWLNEKVMLEIFKHIGI